MTWFPSVVGPAWLTLAPLLGCGSTEPTPSAPEASAHPEVPPPAPTYADQRTPDPRPALDPHRPGAVYLRVGRGPRAIALSLTYSGLAKAADQGVEDLHRAPDGSVWALGSEARRLDGDETIAVPSEAGTPTRMALDASGRVWLASRDGVGRWDGETWVNTPWTDLPAGAEGPAQDLLVDGLGTLWVATLRSVYRFDGSWTAQPVAEGDRAPLAGTLHTGADGTVLLSTSGGLYARGADSWTQLDEVSSHDTFDAHGSHRVHAWRNTAFLVSGDAERRVPIPAGATSLTGVTVDGVGRTWAATDAGLYLLGEPSLWVPLGAGPLRSEIMQVVASGAGPETLPDAPALETVQVRARLVQGDAPLARTAVELCPSPQMLYRGDTPCDGSALRARGKTDADGVITWTAPRAPLRMTFQIDGEWKSVMLGRSFQCCGTAQTATLDLGDVSIPK